MMQIMFTVPGPPHGKGRPRFARRGNFVATYTDAKTSSYEEQVQHYAKQAMGSSKPLEAAVVLYLHIRLPVPPSYSKKRTEACLGGLEWPCKKPDSSNILKSVEDAMNGVVFHDDCQIIDHFMTRVYASEAGVDILIKEKE